MSIIVAVYAAEMYLKKCLNSLLNQTFKDFEIILVDDGSKDTSGLICDEYAKNDSRIRVYHKRNEGVGSARQFGLENASGDYIIHVDPDDWIEPEMISDMYSKATQESADIVICDYYEHKKDGCAYVSQRPDSLESKCVMRELFYGLHGATWNKLMKRDCFDTYGVCFPTHMVVWEDLFVCVNLTRHDLRISYIPKAYYHYVNLINANSMVHSVSRRKLESMIFFINYFENEIPSFDKSLLVRRKVEAKRTAFLISKMKKKEFYAIYSDVNELFVLKFLGFKKIDCLIRFSLLYSWSVSRFVLFFWRLKNTYLKSL